MFRGADTELFLDDAAIAGVVRLARVYEAPRKCGPVLVADRPWEGNCVITNGSVIPHPEGDGYQVWYQVFTRLRELGWRRFCYATSRDGIHWEKPSLGLHECDGSRQNNVVMMDSKDLTALTSPSVIYDRDEPAPERRYKMLFRAATPAAGVGLFGAFSADGIRWDITPEPVAPRVGDRTTLLHDPGARFPYVAYTRRWTMMDDFRRRVVYRSVSDDFLRWSDPEPALVPDLDDTWDLQFYGMPAFRYRDYFIGGLERLWSTPDRIDSELVWSRDGATWRRTRHTFLPNGEPGAWDSEWVSLASSPPIERDGKLWFYLEGRPQAHDRVTLYPRGAIGIAILPKDRFAALEAGSVEGYVTTPPFTWEGGRLLVDVNARANAGRTDPNPRGGSVRVEVLDGDGVPLPGLSYECAEPFHDDTPECEPRWKGGHSLDERVGTTIRLRVHLVNARLYALRRGHP